MSLASRITSLAQAIGADIKALVTGKVDKETGKGLSTNDYVTADKNKLAGIASGATANSSDSYLLSRSNHTGTQTLSTISDAGTAAGRNVQTSATDTNALAVLGQGAYGLGATSAPSSSDANLELRTGFHGGAGAGSSNYAGSTAYGPMLVMSCGGSVHTQLQTFFSPTVTDAYMRGTNNNGASWSPTVQLWHSGNLSLQSSLTDSTSGAVMQTGAGGLLGQAIGRFSASAVEMLRPTEFFRNASSSDNPYGHAGAGAHISYGNTDYAVQIYGSVTNQTRIKARTTVSPGNWNPVVELWHSSNYDVNGAIITPRYGSSYTMDLSWSTGGASYHRFLNSVSSTLVVPAHSSVPFAVGTEFTLRRSANANLTISPASGVTINPPAGGTLVMTHNMTATLKKVGANEWDLIGQTVPA